MARPRIKQFADDLEISYDKAKGLVEEGRRRKDGGTEVLERNMGKMHGTKGSQVGGMSVQEVMDVIERDTHMADQPKNREEKPQGCRGMGAAIKGGKFQGCK